MIAVENSLFLNADKIHTTQMGFDRISKNLGIDKSSVIDYCRCRILDKNSYIYKRGKNWYCETNGVLITINSITAHIIKNRLC